VACTESREEELVSVKKDRQLSTNRLGLMFTGLVVAADTAVAVLGHPVQSVAAAVIVIALSGLAAPDAALLTQLVQRVIPQCTGRDNRHSAGTGSDGDDEDLDD
jgi:hypothetical protein